MKLKKISSLFVLTSAALAMLASCGPNTEIPGDETPTVDLVDDRELDDDNKTVLFDNVELKLWAVGGEPDSSTLNGLINDFNKEYAGQINISVNNINEENYYGQLDTTWRNDKTSFPDIMWIHNNKISLYASKAKQYILPLTEEVLEKSNCQLDFSNVYEGIDRVNMYNGTRYSMSVDAHGFLTYFRQDIIKKNNLGFENNTRYIPESKAEYQSLLEGLTNKAKAGQLYTRDINKGQDHSWKIAPASFAASFMQSSDPDGLTALYANGGSLMDETQDRVTFHENQGFIKYCTDQVENYNKGYITTGTNTALFGIGDIAMFSEGPWWSASNYEPNFNNSELKTAGKGVSAEEAADPVYSQPLVSSHAKGWWTLDENKSSATAQKWYGLGHSICASRNIKSYTKVAAMMEFTNWFTQGKNSKTNEYNLAKWCSSGHIPAWKNVYASDEYKALAEKKATLRGLGDPADIIALESLEFQDTLFSALQTTIVSIQSALTGDGCTVDKAKQIIAESGQACQESVDALKILG